MGPTASVESGCLVLGCLEVAEHSELDRVQAWTLALASVEASKLRCAGVGPFLRAMMRYLLNELSGSGRSRALQSVRRPESRRVVTRQLERRTYECCRRT